MKKVTVMYQGEEHLLLFQYATGLCEIIRDGDPYHTIKLVHESEFELKEESTADA